MMKPAGLSAVPREDAQAGIQLQNWLSRVYAQSMPQNVIAQMACNNGGFRYLFLEKAAVGNLKWNQPTVGKSLLVRTTAEAEHLS